MTSDQDYNTITLEEDSSVEEFVFRLCKALIPLPWVGVTEGGHFPRWLTRLFFIVTVTDYLEDTA